jgi:hypothetical protein
MTPLIQDIPSIGFGILGMVMLISGLRTLLNRSPDMDQDSFLSKKLMSPYTPIRLAVTTRVSQALLPDLRFLGWL